MDSKTLTTIKKTKEQIALYWEEQIENIEKNKAGEIIREEDRHSIIITMRQQKQDELKYLDYATAIITKYTKWSEEQKQKAAASSGEVD